MSKRIETQVSITALGTCLMRATSYYERSLSYKSEDFIAPVIIPPYLAAMIKYTISRAAVKKCLFKVPGIYEYVISRTRFIDDIFENFDAKFEQVLILGAGFDTRAIRFSNELKKTRIFELDAPVTQQAKIRRFTEKRIDFPENLTFISLDFTKESLAEKLDEAGFQKNRQCLFLLEGLTFYLNEEAINSTLNLLNEYSAEGSLLVFDYAFVSAVWREQAAKDPKTKRHYQTLAKAGERPGFVFEGQIQDFLARYAWKLIEDAGSGQLAERYFNQEDFAPAAQKFRIAKAVKKSD
ncbi:methyltransferase ppm1/ppm2/tcmp [Lucifera butyrica]|uniref:S-adenosyl-L-methionine-dependent methyltransferase n=1 Tax=Lucifera butyrica TaxID=1351585 RepID=A0A498RCA1_9FIRM|nr:SAM-dependent methyltransferase [Lucifera butyrica]VBB09011.1 methyltransferase ppm1/ppm2/tcmp [Lucifera butyrica]